MADNPVDRALRKHGLLPAVSDPKDAAEAVARQKELLADPEWRAKAAAGDKDALADIERLSRTIVGDPTPWLTRPGAP
jgi:hypothetical protein